MKAIAHDEPVDGCAGDVSGQRTMPHEMPASPRMLQSGRARSSRRRVRLAPARARDGRGRARSSGRAAGRTAALSPRTEYSAGDRTPFFDGIHAGRDRRPHRIRLGRPDRRQVHRRARFRAAARSSAAGRSAARGQMYSSDAPSRSSISDTRGPVRPCGGDGGCRRERRRCGIRDARARAQRAAAPASQRPRSRAERRRRGCRGGRTSSARPPGRAARRPIAVVAAAPAVIRRAAVSPSAAENPLTLSHISVDATAADAAASHASTGRSTQPGDIGVEAEELARDHQQVEQTARCTP